MAFLEPLILNGLSEELKSTIAATARVRCGALFSNLSALDFLNTVIFMRLHYQLVNHIPNNTVITTKDSLISTLALLPSQPIDNPAYSVRDGDEFISLPSPLRGRLRPGSAQRLRSLVEIDSEAINELSSAPDGEGGRHFVHLRPERSCRRLWFFPETFRLADLSDRAALHNLDAELRAQGAPT
jgi:hypothetical protein